MDERQQGLYTEAEGAAVSMLSPKHMKGINDFVAVCHECYPHNKATTSF